MRVRNVLSSNLRTGFCALVRRAVFDDGECLQNEKSTPLGALFILEAPPGIGPGIEVLQTFALPLGHGAIFTQQTNYITNKVNCQVLLSTK